LNDRYLSWLNDHEVTRYLETGVFPATQQDLEKYYESITGTSNQVLLAIVDKASNAHIGNIKLGPINWIHRRSLLGILIGDKSFWGKGVGLEAMRLMVEYGFCRLNLHRIYLAVFAENEAGVRLYEKVGFKVEGRFRDDMFQDGTYKDRLWMGLLRTEYNGGRPDKD
jgi:RimJ/RimL family protein N-acetyltransferase